MFAEGNTGKCNSCVAIRSGSGSTYIQLLFITSTTYFELGICTGSIFNEYSAIAILGRWWQAYQILYIFLIFKREIWNFTLTQNQIGHG